MVLMTAQHNLSGEELGFEKDRVETYKDVFRGAYFQIIVSEEAHAKLDRMHEHDKQGKIRAWIANHMKPISNHVLPVSKEGEAFQKDFELFAKIL